MTQVDYNCTLKSFNTFGIDVPAERLVHIRKEEELIRFLDQTDQVLPRVLGGGSNILFTQAVEGDLLKNEITGRRVLSVEGENVLLEFGGGENWHDVVLWTLSQGFYGLENLSLIPGTVGAAPIQNIGAYGVELSEHFVSLEAIHLTSGQKKSFDKEECAFAYRNSLFKREYKGQYFISNVRLRLSTRPALRLDYGAIQNTLKDMGITNPGPADVSRAVIQIRRSKLPDPGQLGNAGSFFKNPVVDKPFFESLQIDFPDIPSYPLTEKTVKIPAAWLIEQTGWKGRREGDAGVHKNHALVLVNYGLASGKDISKLAKSIQKAVFQKFRIALEPEVNIW